MPYADIEVRKAKDRERYRRNSEKIKVRSRERYEANREEVLAAHAERLRTDPEWREQKNARRRTGKPRPVAISDEERRARHREREARRRRRNGIPERPPARPLTPEENVARVQAWREANPEKARAASRRKEAARRARLRDATVESVDPQLVWQRDEGVCGICGTAADPDDWHLDHVVPLALGGSHSYDNVQVSHPPCNLRKGTRVLR